MILLTIICQIFNEFTLFGPRFLQYLTVNLKVFAYCSELLHKHFRSLQNDSKSPPRGLLDPLGEAMGAPLEVQDVPKDPQEAPKVTKNPGKWSPSDRQGAPGRPRRSPRGSQGIPEESPRVPKAPQESPPKGPQWVPKGVRASKESVE